jgi:prepilin peptidase CpaA
MTFPLIPDDSESTLALLILAVAGVAVVTDLRRRRIPNALTVPAMVVGLAAHGLASGLSGLGAAATGLLLGAALFLIPVAMGGMGAGDLKLLAALGALGGPGLVFWCAIYTSIAGGVMAVAALLVKRQMMPVLAGAALALSTRTMPRATSEIRLPYAIPIAVGATLALALA